ncbi:MAG: YhdP family protein [Rhodocyclaceae bacterium]|nr:YhdP family protein [Rhodocyclaceae bacterium]
MRPALRLIGGLLIVLYFAAGVLILAGRYWLLPDIERHRPFIERELSAAMGLPVKIDALAADWRGFYPRLAIGGLQLHDREGRLALAFERVEAEIGSSSLWRGLHLRRLEILAPQLEIRRDAAGRLFIAGLPINLAGESDFADWLLRQGRIRVLKARVVWHDELRGAPPLELQDLDFELRNAGRRHHFGLLATPPAEVAARLDLRGELIGRDPADWASWRGRLYAELPQLDLSAWHPWLDLPFEWSQGRGSARLWLEFAELMPTGFTADLQLNEVRLRLAPDLPPLELVALQGRLAAQRSEKGFTGEIRRLTLATREGVVLPETEVHLSLDVSARSAGGRFAANRLDLGALSALAGHLPLPQAIHERLQRYQPRGRLSGLEFSWQGELAAPTHWRAKGQFAELALAAAEGLPGFAGFSGSIAGDETAGEARLQGQQAALILPGVFAEPQLALASLEAELGWKKRRDGLEFSLARAVFRNADAAGEVTGTYRYGGQGLGEIDLAARLPKAAGQAVWRYLPLVVNKDARDWLKNGLVGGVAEDVTLRLKGPLARFPFRDGKSGLFQVKGKILGAKLVFAPGWPEMTGIDGDLLFEGARMVIHGQRADIMGVALSGITAEIPDLEAPEEILHVKGTAAGATQRFLDFIEASPVGARIDHFTAPMRATGQGQLELKLTMPLRRVANTQVEGRYRFAGNELKVLPELPILTALQGEFAFTADRLQAKGVRGRWLGMPITLDVTSLAGGGVRVNAAGRLAAQMLRQEYGWPIFEHLSGETPWRASVTVKKPSAELRIESSLEGLSSSLPEPFNKSALAALPLNVTGRIGPRGDEWNATLGEAAALRLQESEAGWRGRLSLGRALMRAPPALPARGVLVTLAQSRLDLDAWRKLLLAPRNGAVADAPKLPQVSALDVRSDEVQLSGRRFHDLRLSGTQAEGRWRFALESREAQGQLAWEGGGRGRLSGKLQRLHLSAGLEGASWEAEPPQGEEPPAIDLAIEELRLREMSLGEARLKAEPRGDGWQAQLEVKNEAARLTGEGRWRSQKGAAQSRLDFKLDIADAEKLMKRLGLPDAVRRGAGRLEGELAWAGPPFAFDLASLSGRLKAEFEKGQFKKLEPGVGRLLGVLSLQALPRRITLDFRDVFSEGFAFDTIAAEASIERGIMQVDPLRIDGPAARVMLTGKLNLLAETQELKVRVQPSVGETVATGTMLVNPVAGAVVWLAQKAMNDPFGQAFAYEYAITGGWGDPKVEKLSRAASETKSAPP